MSRKHFIRYGWIIDKDHSPDADAEIMTNANANGMIGPHDIDQATMTRLIAGEGAKFRMTDGEGEIFYSGRLVGKDTTGFEPLDDFGMPNAGACSIEYQDFNGKWSEL